MTTIKTISCKNTELWEKAKQVAKREGISLSALINDRLEDYVKVHGEGNPVYSLDKWAENEGFTAVPALLESTQKWVNFIQKTDTKTLREIEEKSHQIQIIASCYQKIEKIKRPDVNFRNIRQMSQFRG